MIYHAGITRLGLNAKNDRWTGHTATFQYRASSASIIRLTCIAAGPSIWALRLRRVVDRAMTSNHRPAPTVPQRDTSSTCCYVQY